MHSALIYVNVSSKQAYIEGDVDWPAFVSMIALGNAEYTYADLH